MAGQPASSCYERAVRLLGQRSHFEAELRLKLSARGYPDAEVDAALERLRQERALDDRRTAEEWVAARRRRGDGPAKLAAGLARRGVAADLARAAATGGSLDRELEDARRAGERWLGRQRDSPPDRAALARHLDRKGYGRRVILAVLDELSARE